MLRSILLAMALATPLAATQLPDFASLPERPVSQPAISRFTASKSNFHVASNGSEFFVVWSDCRQTPWDHDCTTAFGARVDANGRMLDAADIALPFGDDVFWSGSVWVVMRRTFQKSDGYFIRIARDGTVLDPVPRLIAKHGTIEGAAGDRLLLVNGRFASLYDLDARPIVVDTLLDPFIATWNMSLKVAWNGRAFVVAWGGGGFVSMTAIDPMGNVQWQNHSDLPVGHSFRSIACSDAGTTMLIVATEKVVGWMTWDAEGKSISSLREAVYAGTPGDAIWDGREFLLPFVIASRVQAYPIRPDGGTDVSMTLFEGASVGPVAGAFNGQRTLIAGATGAFILSSLAEIGAHPVDLGHAANPQFDFVVASNDRLSLVAWRELDLVSGTYSINAIRVGANGAILDAKPFRVATMPCSVASIADASDGRDFMVFAGQNGEIDAWRVTRDGLVLDRQPIAVATNPAAGTACDRSAAPLSAAGTGQAYVVAWMTSSGDIPAVFLARVTTAGAVLDREPIVLGRSKLVRPPAVASNGDDFAIVWNDDGAYALRLASDGALLDAKPLPLMPTWVDTVFWDGTNYVAEGQNVKPYGFLLPAGTMMRFPAKSGTAIDTPGMTTALALDLTDVWPVRSGCDASGCAVIGAFAAQMIDYSHPSYLRVTATAVSDTAGGLTGAQSVVTMLPWPVGNDLSPQVQWLGGSTFVYQRPDPASGGVMRVFIRSAQHERSRAAGRH